MSSPNDAPDQNQPTPPNGGFVSPGGETSPRGDADATTPPPAAPPGGQQTPASPSYGTPSYGTPAPGGPSYGGQPYGGQPYGSQPYGGQPGYGGGQPPYGAPSGEGTSGTNMFGLVALIIGGISLVLALIPIINYVSGVLSLVGLALGIVGLVVKNRKRGLAIAGTIVSALALVLAIVLAIVYTVGFTRSVVDEFSDNLPTASSVPSDGSSPDPDARTVDVVYEVTGEGTDATIVYLSVTSTDVNDIETLSAQTLPWTEEFEATVGGEFDYSTFNVTASNGAADEGPISCRITVDGEVVAEDTTDGAFGTVSCTSSDVLD